MIDKLAQEAVIDLKAALKAGEGDLHRYFHSFRQKANSVDPALKEAVEAEARRLGAAAATQAPEKPQAAPAIVTQVDMKAASAPTPGTPAATPAPTAAPVAAIPAAPVHAAIVAPPAPAPLEAGEF